MAHASRPSAVGRGTLAFLYGLCAVEELPGSYLVEIFGALNMSASGARSYLARAVADGRLVSHRRGRQTAYALNGTFLRRYRTIEHRFISRPDWEGRFHIVIYDIPETRRSERDALRAAARAWPLDEAAQKPPPPINSCRAGKSPAASLGCAVSNRMANRWIPLIRSTAFWVWITRRKNGVWVPSCAGRKNTAASAATLFSKRRVMAYGMSAHGTSRLKTSKSAQTFTTSATKNTGSTQTLPA